MKLPTFTPNRLAIKLKPAAERMVKKGHPWVFDDAIVKQSTPGKTGDLAIIFDQKKNKFIACGLYDAHSPIRIKILHSGKSVQVNSDFFKVKIEAARELRQPLLETDTDSYRLIYGENDGFPGLIADVYADVLVVKLYSEIWLPYFEDILADMLRVSDCKTAVLRLSRKLQEVADKYDISDGEVVYGRLESEVVYFKEHGLSFAANVVYGHKTGYFLDHRNNRKRVGELAKEKTVLDVFAYAGGFSVHALAGGAREVTSLDISAQALAMARQNADLNSHSGKHKTIVGDAFEVLEKMSKNGQQFDMVVIDPPSFAKRAKEVEKAKYSYRRLAILGTKLVKSDGILVLASCSSRVNEAVFFDISSKAIDEILSDNQLIDKTLHDIDHPITFPEGAYLKCGYWRISR